MAIGAAIPTLCCGTPALIANNFLAGLQRNLPGYSGRGTSPTLDLASLAIPFGAWLGFFFLECALVAAAGYFLKNDPLYFFYVEPNLFDVEDIAAMNQSVHKSVLRALDKAGIDTKLLRPKQEFTTGRHGEKI